MITYYNTFTFLIKYYDKKLMTRWYQDSKKSSLIFKETIRSKSIRIYIYFISTKLIINIICLTLRITFYTIFFYIFISVWEKRRRNKHIRFILKKGHNELELQFIFKNKICIYIYIYTLTYCNRKFRILTIYCSIIWKSSRNYQYNKITRSGKSSSTKIYHYL